MFPYKIHSSNMFYYKTSLNPPTLGSAVLEIGIAKKMPCVYERLYILSIGIITKCFTTLLSEALEQTPFDGHSNTILERDYNYKVQAFLPNSALKHKSKP